MLLYEFVAFAFFPFPNVRRLLDVLPIDSVEPNVASVVVYVDAVVFRFSHILTFCNYNNAAKKPAEHRSKAQYHENRSKVHSRGKAICVGFIVAVSSKANSAFGLGVDS
jgi:hypothetical protein